VNRRSRSWIWLAVVLGFIVFAGYLYYFGSTVPAIIGSISFGSSNSGVTVTTTVTTTITTTITNTASNSVTASNSAAYTPSLSDYVDINGINIDGIKRSLRDLFLFILGNDLMDAIFNIFIILTCLIIAYVVLKFVKYIAIIIVFVGGLLIVLRYVLGVI